MSQFMLVRVSLVMFGLAICLPALPSLGKDVYPLTFKRMEIVCKAVAEGSNLNDGNIGQIKAVCNNEFRKISVEVNVKAEMNSTLDFHFESTGQATREAALPGFNQSAILFGLTDFLIERAEVEAETFLLDRFTDDLCKERDDGVSGGELLPQTCGIFDTDDRTLTFLTGSGSVLRTTLLKDLRALPRFLPAAAYEDAKNDRQRQQLVSAYLLGTVLEKVLNNDSLIEAIRTMPPPDALTGEFPDIDSTTGVLPKNRALSFPQRIYFASRVFQALPVEDGNMIYPVSDSDWENLFRAVYLNTAYYDHGVRNVDTFRKDLQRAVDAVGPFARVQSQYKEFESAITRLKQAKEQDATEPTDETARAVRQSAGYVVHHGLAALRATLTTLIPVEPSKKASGAASNTVSDTEALEILTGMETVSQSLVSLDYATFAASLVLVAREMDVDLPGEVTRVVFLGGELANAKDASSARTAIESFAAPPGGYLRKKVGRGNYMALNAYFGLHGNRDYTTGGGLANGAWGGGLLLPLGIEIGYGYDNGWNAGVFAQVLDLGVLANYRITGPEEIEELPEIGVQQVISPGAFVVVGFPKAPVSMLGGVAYAPKLRNITDAGSTEERAVGSFRFSLGFALDLTLFP